jgi:hypothetical protein
VPFKYFHHSHFVAWQSRLPGLGEALVALIRLTKMQILRRSGWNFSIRSKISTHGQSDSWHRQESLEAGDRHPVGVGFVPDAAFPGLLYGNLLTVI